VFYSSGVSDMKFHLRHWQILAVLYLISSSLFSVFFNEADAAESLRLKYSRAVYKLGFFPTDLPLTNKLEPGDLILLRHSNKEYIWHVGVGPTKVFSPFVRLFITNPLLDPFTEEKIGTIKVTIDHGVNPPTVNSKLYSRAELNKEKFSSKASEKNEEHRKKQEEEQKATRLKLVEAVISNPSPGATALYTTTDTQNFISLVQGATPVVAATPAPPTVNYIEEDNAIPLSLNLENLSQSEVAAIIPAKAITGNLNLKSSRNRNYAVSFTGFTQKEIPKNALKSYLNSLKSMGHADQQKLEQLIKDFQLFDDKFSSSSLKAYLVVPYKVYYAKGANVVLSEESEFESSVNLAPTSSPDAKTTYKFLDKDKEKIALPAEFLEPVAVGFEPIYLKITKSTRGTLQFDIDGKF
jgi:hypothetical protein